MGGVLFHVYYTIFFWLRKLCIHVYLNFLLLYFYNMWLWLFLINDNIFSWIRCSALLNTGPVGSCCAKLWWLFNEKGRCYEHFRLEDQTKQRWSALFPCPCSSSRFYVSERFIFHGWIFSFPFLKFRCPDGWLCCFCNFEDYFIILTNCFS